MYGNDATIPQGESENPMVSHRRRTAAGRAEDPSGDATSPAGVAARQRLLVFIVAYNA